MTFSLRGLFVTLGLNGTNHKQPSALRHSAIMLSVILLVVVAPSGNSFSAEFFRLNTNGRPTRTYKSREKLVGMRQGTLTGGKPQYS